MIDRILTPFQKFDKVESLSGILLFGASLLALIWANSPLSPLYHGLLQHEIGFRSEGFELAKPLLLWVNDGLMAVFFFLIGLEIKREVLIGELNTPRKAALPFMAALGGMVVPVALYLLLNGNPATRDGWGLSMATDIAFSLAILKLLGSRVPVGLKIFLTAFAIVDDLGAVVVIAAVYSTGIKVGLLLAGLVAPALLSFLSFRRIYSRYLLLAGGIVCWFCFLKAGIHPTLAGVLMAFAVPIRQRMDMKSFNDRLAAIVDRISRSGEPESPLLSKKQIEEIDNLEDWTDRVQSPLQHLEHRLHNWVAYLVMPVFALFNAGITFGGGMQLDGGLALQVMVSLVIGKLAGIALFSFAGVKLGLAELPDEASPVQVVGVAALAGVGFTMSIFIANLAFDGTPYTDSAKAGILAGSVIAGLAGYLILRLCGKRR